ncbi:hypothetical protein C8R47DRAFT_398299 [Mycena vitilis]|nr:hypothetical protein C8R47DRAFT_398299 [Mycena vitilis]
MSLIHPPFTDLPEGFVLTEAMSYAVLQLHPTWFLDANDYLTLAHHQDGGAVTSRCRYPRELEPASQKSGPRLLRCTFCPLNFTRSRAKPMWMRHVRQKHRIVLSNEKERARNRRASRKSKANRKLAAATAKPMLPPCNDGAQAHAEMDVEEDGCIEMADEQEDDIAAMSSAFTQLHIPPTTQ